MGKPPLGESCGSGESRIYTRVLEILFFPCGSSHNHPSPPADPKLETKKEESGEICINGTSYIDTHDFFYLKDILPYKSGTVVQPKQLT